MVSALRVRTEEHQVNDIARTSNTLVALLRAIQLDTCDRAADEIERLQRELADRPALLDGLSIQQWKEHAKAGWKMYAARAENEPAVRHCNHGAISPKGTMFYHGFVSNKFNQWRCDVCRGIYEGNLTEPMNPGSQALTLVSSPPPPAPALRDVAAERERQKSEENWTPKHDDEHSNGELAQAAACYALEHPGYSGFTHQWPWDSEWWKPKDRRRNLVRAGALILAEIERLDRATATKEVTP
jgi:hypothetical protein